MFPYNSVPNAKQYGQWLEEMFVTLAQHWSLQNDKYPNMSTLAKALVSLDCGDDKNGVGLFFHLLQQHGLEPSLVFILKYRLLHSNYVDCSPVWLKNFADFIANGRSSNEAIDTVTYLRGGYFLCEKEMKVILALMEEKCKIINRASFSESYSSFYGQFVDTKDITFDDWLDCIVTEWSPMMSIDSALSTVIPKSSTFIATCLAIKDGSADSIAVYNSLLPISLSPFIARLLQQIETSLSPSNQNNTCKHVLRLLFNSCFHIGSIFAEKCTEY
ncbi:hypothetical protein RFI_34556 [Reticulomyxa filosa]|uniref:Uncharacterized protein n=1 Tax=Reticulomyxa filosa TaxID=46433 RepID=X6LNZ2_RETFI|nr:hypothetical protein RFI_34556 [Reticulomyxa filosa]|eukprot:ETO02857.1 hypothetical protein RFI_34556 [Reticulomyxa filosa]